MFALYGLHRGSSADADTMARRARLAEEAGFEGLWVGDHIALPVGGFDPPGQPRIEAVVALTHLAALTTRIRLGFGVIVLPQRQPVLLAKLTAMLVLWQQPEPAFSGRFVSFEGITQYPPPVRRPHPPIIVGGHSPAAYRRAVTSGNGWYGWDLTPEQVAATLTELRAAATRHDRPAALGELEITVTPPAVPDLDTVRRYAEAGVHRLVIQPSTMDGTAMDELITTVGDTLIGTTRG